MQKEKVIIREFTKTAGNWKPVIRDFGAKRKMKIDMSPKAVTERLKTLDEFWLLSVKLMNSKKVKCAKEKENELPDHACDSRFAREKDRV